MYFMGSEAGQHGVTGLLLWYGASERRVLVLLDVVRTGGKNKTILEMAFIEKLSTFK